MCLVTDGWPAVRVESACLSVHSIDNQSNTVLLCVCAHVYVRLLNLPAYLHTRTYLAVCAGEAYSDYVCVNPGCFTFKQGTLTTVNDLNAWQIAS